MQDKIFKSKILSETNNNPHFVKIICDNIEWIDNNEGRGYLTCDVARYIVGRGKKSSKPEILAEYTKKLNAVWSTCNIKIKGEK